MSKKNSSFGIANILKIISKPDSHVHFLGVGGAGMSSLFCLSRYFGISVSGSDRSESPLIKSLVSLGADIAVGKREELPSGTSLLVYSLAIGEGDPEILLAERAGVPCVSRAEYLGAVCECYGERIAVSGSHGKSTVTAMLYRIFEQAGKNPTALSGAKLDREHGNFDIGSLDILIYEACEYKDSFLIPSPTTSLFLNLELDHVDYFKNIDDISASFDIAMKKCGRAIVNTDDKILDNLAKNKKNIIRVGSGGDEDYVFSILSKEPFALSFLLSGRSGELCRINLVMLGEFNIVNAAMAAACALEFGISADDVSEALSGFCGIEQRLECIGKLYGAPVYYDYAHHPTEIREGIRAVRSATEGNVAVVFAPHTYSRTGAFLKEFADALSYADYRLITDITAAREDNVSGISPSVLAEISDGVFVKNKEELLEKIPRGCSAYILMGAGDLLWVRGALEI